jgi:hypothetical protein
VQLLLLISSRILYSCTKKRENKSSRFFMQRSETAGLVHLVPSQQLIWIFLLLHYLLLHPAPAACNVERIRRKTLPNLHVVTTDRENLSSSLFPHLSRLPFSLLPFRCFDATARIFGQCSVSHLLLSSAAD